jgi:hypothetical protein
MAMTAGSAPTSWTSTLTGLSLLIYNNKISQGVFKGESQIEVIVGERTFTETEIDRNNRVFSDKKTAYAEALSAVNYITANAVVNTTVTGTAGGDPIVGGAGVGGVS